MAQRVPHLEYTLSVLRKKKKIKDMYDLKDYDKKYGGKFNA